MGVVRESMPFCEEEVAGCKVISEGKIREEGSGVFTSGDVCEGVVGFEAERAGGLDAEAMFAGPTVISKSDNRGVDPWVDPAFEESDAGNPFFDVTGGAIFRVEPEVFVPSCSTHSLGVV